MRFVHTADWHLGRLFHGRHLTEDQAHVLDQLVDVLRDARAEALVIAGDLYDRAVPPVEAVRLLDDVLTRVTDGLGIPVVAIAGNHDAPDRVGFGARLLADKGLHVFGRPGAAPGRVTLADTHGPVTVHALPYAEPALVREAIGRDDLHDHDAAFRAVVAEAARDAAARHVLVAHAFVTGGRASDSERPLSVGGTGAVGADALAGFDYVALGHLHRPQTAGRESARYAGSLLKYSFSEADHAKAVLVVDLDAAGEASVEAVRLAPRRDVRIVEGRLEELLEGPAASEGREDYLLARLKDREALFDPLGKLRAVYPNVMQVERVHALDLAGAEARAAERRGMGDLELFAAFAKEVSGEGLSPAEDEEMRCVLADLERGRRET